MQLCPNCSAELVGEYCGSLATAVAGRELGLPLLLSFALGYCVMAPYVFLALRRVYSPSITAALVVTALLLVVKIFFYDLVDAAAVNLTLRLV